MTARTAGLSPVVGGVTDADVREVGAARAIAVVGAVLIACEMRNGLAQQDVTRTVLLTLDGLHQAPPCAR
jgi:hypothetical protein